MVTREEKPIFIEERGTSRCVARHGNRRKVFRERDRVGALDDPLGIRDRVRIVTMNDPLRPELFGVLGRVRDIIFMRQKDVSKPAVAFEEIGQLLDVARRVHQPITVGTPHEEAVRSEWFLTIEAAVIDPVFQVDGKAGARGLQCRLITPLGADRPHRTGEQGLIGLMDLLIGFRLVQDGRIVPDFFEACRR